MYQQNDEEDPKYRIVVKSQYSATLTVTHTCGHTAHYRYGGESAAQQDVENKLSSVCAACYPNQQLASSKCQKTKSCEVY
jgi:hypothetical protein